jgi:hypothetical protein
LLWHRGESFALELKSEHGQLSQAQKEFQRRFAEAGGRVATAYGLDEALETLRGWDLLTDRTRCSAACQLSETHRGTE